MELKKGMYVRDATNGIGIVTNICTCEQCKNRGFYEPIITYADSIDYVTSFNYMQYFENKADFNLLNLIKVGDLVNGKCVEGFVASGVILTGVEAVGVKDIKNILIKEQYQNKCFDLEVKNELYRNLSKV